VSNVLELPCWTRHDLPVDTVLENNKGKFVHVLILALDANGGFAAATSHADIFKNQHLAQKFIHKCHDGSYTE
jgi:hypothetical protein